jgi:hypothetical protein
MHEISEVLRVAAPMASMGGLALAARFIRARQRQRGKRTADIQREARLWAGPEGENLAPSESPLSNCCRPAMQHDSQSPGEGGPSWANS